MKTAKRHNVTLRNNFHNSEVKLQVRGERDDDGLLVIYPSAGQIKKSWRTLCGHKNCECGDAAGARGPQRADDGSRLVVDTDAYWATLS